MAKGSNFEREICKLLSLWWTANETDDVFWRSASSGARATIRSKFGKKTFGQYGDVQATDPIGQPLIDFATIEIKRGYKLATISDIIDALETAKTQQFMKFIEQVQGDMEKAESFTWFLITKRDRREAMLYMPLDSFNSLDLSYFEMDNVSFRSPERNLKIRGCRLTDFVRYCKPYNICNFIKKEQQK